MVTSVRKEKNRDDREFDTTQLRAAGHGKTLGRDYSGHFFRWSFARRFITTKDNVLEVGCGEDRPLSKILTGGAAAHVNKYVGVDLNKLKPSASQRLAFHGEFNFVERYKELLKGDFKEGFDVAVHYEVIEHMKVEHGEKMLKAVFAALKPGGVMLMSTPCYDGVRHAANHIHEYTVPELQKYTEKAGFVVEKRYGVFMDIKHIGKADTDRASKSAIAEVRKALAEYYDNDAISCLFAPLYPDHARNNLWICRKPLNGKPAKSEPARTVGAKATGKVSKKAPF
jgi:2-polyprenyl-3-methyl-5-hydroxy-6-metoxy-1,4-benzoquinol methylase